MAVNPDNSAPVRSSAFRRSDTLRFGEFELSIKTAELHRKGKPIKLQHQPCRVLAILAAHAGELVTRDELRQEIWPNGTFVDFEHGINFCIKQIRSALGDEAQSPRYVETLPRRGYRFIAPVEILNGGFLEPSGQAAADRPSDQRPEVADVTSNSTSAPNAPGQSTVSWLWARLVPTWSRSPYVAGLLVGAALLAAVAYLVSRPSTRPGAPPPGKIMLAVIPFDYVGEDSSRQFLADGLTEEMIMQLGGLEPRRLGVIARTTVMRYRQSGQDSKQTGPGIKQISPDIKQISKDLGVEYVVEGSVREDGDRVSIAARLIQASDQTPLWSQSFESARGGVLTVQKSIAGNIARSLAIKLLPSTSDTSAADATGNAESHELYLRAAYLKNKGDAADLQRSVDYFQQAVQRDPVYALAYSGLADSYRLLGLTGASPAVEVFPKSRAAALRALELDDRLAEAHSAIGSVRFWFERSLPEAEREFERAIDLNPSYGWAHHDYAWLLVAAGRFDEAIAQIKQAQALDPLSPLANSDVGWVYLFGRRYDEAIQQIKRTLDLEPGFGSARACLIQAYIYKGMIKEAVALGREEMARGGASSRDLASTDNSEATGALTSYLRWALEKAQRPSGTAQISPCRIARLYAQLGDRNRALASLAEALGAPDPMLVFVNVDPAYDGLRSDSRFVALVQRSGLSS
jgi:TolB-like protein/DNA-binding winged helix-turn-helix (wHTH) protein/Tfp pilus assembly protein PilF